MLARYHLDRHVGMLKECLEREIKSDESFATHFVEHTRLVRRGDLLQLGRLKTSLWHSSVDQIVQLVAEYEYWHVLSMAALASILLRLFELFDQLEKLFYLNIRVYVVNVEHQHEYIS